GNDPVEPKGEEHFRLHLFGLGGLLDHLDRFLAELAAHQEEIAGNDPLREEMAQRGGAELAFHVNETAVAGQEVADLDGARGGIHAYRLAVEHQVVGGGRSDPLVVGSLFFVWLGGWEGDPPLPKLLDVVVELAQVGGSHLEEVAADEQAHRTVVRPDLAVEALEDRPAIDYLASRVKGF